jgi:hypothetical protein
MLQLDREDVVVPAIRTSNLVIRSSLLDPQIDQANSCAKSVVPKGLGGYKASFGANGRLRFSSL